MRLLSPMIIAAVLLAGCDTDINGNEPSVLSFEMYQGTYDPAPFYLAWSAAQASPAVGVQYTFPVVSAGMEPGTEVRLYVGHSTTGGTPLESGNDVILTDVGRLSTAWLDADGRAEFLPLEVVAGDWTSDSNSIQLSFLCGTTVIAARAFRTIDGDVRGDEFIDSTWVTAPSAPCQ